MHRIMLGRAFTIIMILFNLAVVLPITVQEVFEWLSRWSHVTKAAAGEDLLLAFPGQGPVGVILVALGVVLEGRHTFLRKVLKLYQLDDLPGQEAFCDACELFGFYLLILGLVIECFSELTRFTGINNNAVLLAFGAASIVLNVVAIVLLLQLTYQVARIRLSHKPGAQATARAHS